MNSSHDPTAASVGILMLETNFSRPPGDIGNPATWPFPVRYRVVRGASPARVVRDRDGGRDALLTPFLDAALELAASGVAGVTTSCGFLSLFQRELATRCPVPVATSALLQIPLIERLLPPGRRVGVITVSAADLGSEHLAAAGAAADTPVVGVDAGGELARVVLGDEAGLDVGKARADMMAAGRELLARHPQVAAVLLECTNMSPYSRELRRALSLPVYDTVSFIRWFQAGLQPPCCDG